MSSKQILVLTGDITHCEKLKQNLEAEGYTVDIAYRGDEAINILKRKWVDLIITSITLQGGMNGIHFLQEIKKNKELQNIPVIVQTSKVNMEENIKGLGVNLFITKPYDMGDLIKKIKEILPD